MQLQHHFTELFAGNRRSAPFISTSKSVARTSEEFKLEFVDVPRFLNHQKFVKFLFRGSQSSEG